MFELLKAQKIIARIMLKHANTLKNIQKMYKNIKKQNVYENKRVWFIKEGYLSSY